MKIKLVLLEKLRLWMMFQILLQLREANLEGLRKFANQEEIESFKNQFCVMMTKIIMKKREVI
jgi:hypothetical protein